MMEYRLKGVALSRGIAMGRAFFFKPQETKVAEFSIGTSEVDGEIQRYRSALFSSRKDLQQLHTHLLKGTSQEAATLIESHLEMLDDPFMTEHIEERIRDTLENPEMAFRTVIRDYEKRFSQRATPFFQERLTDVMDVAQRVLGHLRPSQGSVVQIPPHSIVIAEELLPSHIASMDTSHVVAFVTLRGGELSHAALMARAKGIPYICSIAVEEIQDQMLIVDADHGDVIVNPLESTFCDYSNRVTPQALEEVETVEGVIFDVNVGDVAEWLLALPHHPHGVGLFRSEMLAIKDPRILSSEEEQYARYVELVRALQGRQVNVRAFDVGGDKLLEFAEGRRGIQWLLYHAALFTLQLRALLRAAVHGQVRLLLPFIADPEEVLRAQHLLLEAQNALHREGIPYKPLSVGCMIELPSAVILCDQILASCDFISVGTNDLRQYTLGLNRCLDCTADTLHPSLVWMLRRIHAEAALQGKEVSLCGEVASNPRLIPTLLELGFTHFSCAPSALSHVRRAAHTITCSRSS